MERQRLPEPAPQKELQLENTTTDTIYRLHKLLDAKREGFALCPEDLYLQAPNADVWYEEYIDNGCHGGSVARHRDTLSSSPVEILRIEGSRPYGISIKISLPNGYSSSLSYQEGMQFLQDTRQDTEQEAMSPIIATRIKELLAQSGGILHLDQAGMGLIMPDCKPLLASAADQFKNPVTHSRLRTTDTSSYKPTYHALKGNITALLDAVQSKDGIKVKLYLDGDTETDWEPLEAIAFSTPSPNAVLVEQQLFIAASRLIRNQTAGQAPDKTSLTILRQQTSQPLRYTIANLSPRHPNDSFVTASLDKKGQLSQLQPHVARLNSAASGLTDIFMNVGAIENHHNVVWLHDIQARIATPLSRAALSLSTKSSFLRQAIHVSDYLKSGQ